MADTPRVLSIPPGCPFLPTLVDALLGGRLLPGFPAAPDSLAEATIYLPTRRAAPGHPTHAATRLSRTLQPRILVRL